jgi:uncharacterized protein (DUF1800 family)
MGAIAATRFGLGARPGEINEAASDPRGWLKAQIRPEAGLIPQTDLLSSKQVFEARVEGLLSRRGSMGGSEPEPSVNPAQEVQRTLLQQVQREAREGLQKEIEARSGHAAITPDPFAERWVRFWSNHFTVAARNAQMIGLVGPFEREAIRPHIFGRFQALLAATSFHPAMLTYLDAARSVGPSTFAARQRDAGLNENLAREILELHTMGVGSGYDQVDIIEFAKALTGWTVGGPQAARLASLRMETAGGRAARGTRSGQVASRRLLGRIGEAVFVEELHEPGPRKVLGFVYSGSAEQQAAMILKDLSRHPATARLIAFKLARHFVSDAPPASAIGKLEDAFLRSEGDLAVLAGAVIDLEEAWGAQLQKFKSPEELLISASRATGSRTAFGGAPRQIYVSLAQQPFSAPSPAGWPDDTASWSGPDAMKKRLEWANAVSRRMIRGDAPRSFLDQALGDLASRRTRDAVARAESSEQGMTIALMCPEFQRR